jgi:hypothetical protein
MTWELAESGKGFITTLVNRTDLVPSFSLVSAAELHTEVLPLLSSLGGWAGNELAFRRKSLFVTKEIFCNTCSDYNYSFAFSQYR